MNQFLHLHFYDRAAVPVMLRMESATVFRGYSLQHATMPGAEQLQDGAMAVACRMLRELCGTHWRRITPTPAPCAVKPAWAWGASMRRWRFSRRSCSANAENSYLAGDAVDEDAVRK